MRASSGQGRGDRGQATVEFALILPLLVLCIAGIVWVGQLTVTQVRLEHAAREGARAAAVEPERASAAASNAVGWSMPEASVATRLEAEFVVVEVAIEVEGVPLIGIGSRRLSADAHMRREDLIEQ